MKSEEFKLPEGWKWVKLGEVVDIRLSNVDKKIRSNEIIVKLCNYLEVYQNDYITSSLNFTIGTVTKEEKDKFKVEKGDVIITKDSESFDDIAKPAYVKDNITNLVCGYHLCLLKPHAGLVDGLYLAKVLKLPIINKQFQKSANGITRFGLSKVNITNSFIPLPPLPEQQKIAEILETVDNAVEKTEKIIEKYKRIKQGLMQELLTKGIDENWQIRSKKTNKFKDSPLGRIPEEWEVVMLGEVIEIYDKLRIPLDSEYRTTIKGDIPYCGAAGVIDYINDYIFNGEYVLIAEDGGRFNRFEESAYIMRGKFWANNHVHVVKGREKVLENLFLKYYIDYEDISYYISGSTREKLNQQLLKNILIPLPPLPEQQRIAEVLSQIDKVIEKEENYKRKLENLKRGLMEDLLTGKVRVNPLLEM